MWAVIAEKDDPFMCLNFIDFPTDDKEFMKRFGFKTEDDIKKLIKKKIINVSNMVIVEVRED